MIDKCKWCGSVYVYTLHNKESKEKFYGEKEIVIEYKALGCNDCGKITFMRIERE